MKIFKQDIGIDLQTLLITKMLLCANSGGGKSYAVRKILEEAGSEVMSIIFDIEGEFKTLREKYDYLLIGSPGDVPVSMMSAPLLPQRLLELNLSTIIDISDFEMHDRVMYVKKFLEALMKLPRKFWKPCIIVIDEAHLFAGQQEKQESTRALIDLAVRGRKRGFCALMATTRIAKLHKDICAELNNNLVGRFCLDVDMKRASEILGFVSKEDMLSLRNLQPGEFYTYGPAISQAVKKVEVSKVITTHPKVGMDIKSKTVPPTDKIKSILSELNNLPKEAEEKARTLEECKAKIRELERQLRQIPAAKINESQIQRAERTGYTKAQNENQQIIQNLTKENKQLAGRLSKILELAKIDIPVTTIDSRTKQFTKHIVAPIKPVEIPLEIRNIPLNPESDKTLNRCERSILSLLYNNGNRTFSKILIGVFTGYSHKSGGFNNAICHLNSLGLISRNGGEIGFNSMSLSDAEVMLGSDINLHEEFTIVNWAHKLPKCESSIFQFLMQNRNEAFSKEQIGESTGYQPNSGGFNNAICRLNSLGLIVRANGQIKFNQEITEL